ncbi:MAG: sarcosine oxidase subunit alpha family protein [Rhodobacteraceae bacterium]|nr:MAG: sarcosine oxidase subunit alpha family protein [Paracoccaceae bacterium]
MSHRLPEGGRLIDRSRPLPFTFNGKPMRGYHGDTLASGLLGNGQVLVGRSFKYHRPRGIVTSGPEEPNALVGLGRDKTFEPNARATTTELFDGLEAGSQNHWPSLEFDVGEINASLSKFLPAGFYYKMFLWPRAFWKHVYEPFIRQSAGLGRPPRHRDADSYEYFHATVDVLVIGGGIAGLTAAKAAADAGAEVLLVEQTAHWGGRAPVDGVEVDGKPAGDWVADTKRALEAMPNVRLRSRAMGAGVYDHGYALVYERLADHAPDHSVPRHRLWKVRAGQIVTATGAIERPLAFAGNDMPGVMLASAVRDYVVNHAVAPGRKTVIVTNTDDAYRTALALKEAGLSVPVIVDARSHATGPLPEAARAAGIRVTPGRGIAKVTGKGKVEAVHVCDQSGAGDAIEEVEADCVAMSGGWSPVGHLWSHCGGKLVWDDAEAFFRPDAERAPTGADGVAFVRTAGMASGAVTARDVLEDAHKAGVAAADAVGQSGAGAVPVAEPESRQPLTPVWTMPANAPYELKAKSWLDYQNDVKVTDVELAAREGFESVEHAKRYTTLGMATDQGKLSNINGLAILAGQLGEEIPKVGTTTFRPPYTPISMGAIAGEARGDLFQPLRKTPMHDWHEANGAHWEPVGHWRRPYAFPRDNESVHDAVIREVTAAREGVGLLDASTLGKLIVKGPDAGRFLDMLYTNMMSTLPVGKCRYGLMCTENGFLTDDGVVARMSDDTWLCHTTTGGAERIHAHMEEWLQTEWWDWKVYVANVTEQYAQIGVVGPKAREVLQALGGDMDLSKEALPFMQWADGRIGDFDARVFRISFSGELSYEIAVPASQGMAFWQALLEAGKPHGITPYGTECLHIMRAEKGFIMIGDETDGTVIPQDLGLNWAISKKKDDYLGKRAQEREHMRDPLRWKLVGLETEDGSVLPDGVYAVEPGVNDNGQRKTEGRVTSTYHSPTLERGIAMGLVERGPDRMGEVLSFPTLDGGSVRAKIVSPVFYDPDGEKQNV